MAQEHEEAIMNPAVASLLIALILFETKHFLGDFVLQSNWQFHNKGTYGHPGGLVHAGIHAIGSIAAMLVLTRSPQMIGALCFAEFAIHYHCDWAKQKVDARFGLSSENWNYWVVYGTDQFIHQMTYVGMMYLLEM